MSDRVKCNTVDICVILGNVALNPSLASSELNYVLEDVRIGAAVESWTCATVCCNIRKK
jgi:hypothetical protein